MNAVLKATAKGVSTFAVVDVASTGMADVVSGQAVSWRSLYARDAVQQLGGSAPYALAPSDMGRLIELTWGRKCCVVASCSGSFEDFRHHLRKFLMIQQQDGGMTYFRFYDPRILRVFLLTCTNAQLIEFFGPITAFYVEGEDPETCLVFRLNAGALEVEMMNIDDDTVESRRHLITHPLDFAEIQQILVPAAKRPIEG